MPTQPQTTPPHRPYPNPNHTPLPTPPHLPNPSTTPPWSGPPNEHLSHSLSPLPDRTKPTSLHHHPPSLDSTLHPPHSTPIPTSTLIHPHHIHPTYPITMHPIYPIPPAPPPLHFPPPLALTPVPIHSIITPPIPSLLPTTSSHQYQSKPPDPLPSTPPARTEWLVVGWACY